MATVLNLASITALNRQQFHQLCINNPELQLERNPQGELIIMSPVVGIRWFPRKNIPIFSMIRPFLRAGLFQSKLVKMTRD